MSSPFNPKHQNQHLESKIVAALERVSEAFRVLLWTESKQNSLSPIQIQILIFLLFQSREKCKVSYLAQEFNMTKATVSDSVKVLLKKGLIEKQDHPEDTRSYLIALTASGKKMAEASSSFSLPIEKPLNTLTPEQKEVMLTSLLKLIKDLNKAGIITVPRMCYTCANYRSRSNGHFCNLLNTELADSEIRVDCPEHELAHS